MKSPALLTFLAHSLFTIPLVSAVNNTTQEATDFALTVSKN